MIGALEGRSAFASALGELTGLIKTTDDLIAACRLVQNTVKPISQELV